MVKIVEQGHKFEPDPPNGEQILKHIEKSGRTCYLSEGKGDGTLEGAKKFVSSLLKKGHESVLEHSSFSVRFITDRGVTHELVRHRLVAYSQESTRFCNYSQDKFGNEIAVIKPVFFEEGSSLYMRWLGSIQAAEEAYFDLLAGGAKPEEARSVLPNSLKTEIVTTANLREWRHILKLRTSKRAHPQISTLMLPLVQELQRLIPVVFDDCDTSKGSNDSAQP